MPKSSGPLLALTRTLAQVQGHVYVCFSKKTPRTAFHYVLIVCVDKPSQGLRLQQYRLTLLDPPASTTDLLFLDSTMGKVMRDTTSEVRTDGVAATAESPIKQRLAERRLAAQEARSSKGADVGLLVPTFAGGFSLAAYASHVGLIAVREAMCVATVHQALIVDMLFNQAHFQAELAGFYQELLQPSIGSGHLLRQPIPKRFIVRVGEACHPHACTDELCWQGHEFSDLFQFTVQQGKVVVALYRRQAKSAGARTYRPSFVFTGPAHSERIQERDDMFVLMHNPDR